MHSFDSAHRDFFGCGRRRQVLVQLASVGFRDMTILESADDNALFAAERTADVDFIAGADRAVRLGRLAVDRNFAALTRLLRLGSRPKEARDIQPDVQANVFECAHFRVSGLGTRLRTRRSILARSQSGIWYLIRRSLIRFETFAFV